MKPIPLLKYVCCTNASIRSRPFGSVRGVSAELQLMDMPGRNKLECRIAWRINPLDVYASLGPEYDVATLNLLRAFPQVNAATYLPLCIIKRTMREVDYVNQGVVAKREKHMRKLDAYPDNIARAREHRDQYRT